MFVRTASSRDIEAVRALLVETWHDTYDAIYGPDKVTAITDDWHSIASLEARLVRPNSEFLVADDGERIGGLLLDEIESCFPDADKVRLEVAEANAKAVTFYLAQGFAKVGMTANCGSSSSDIPAAIYERSIVWAD